MSYVYICFSVLKQYYMKKQRFYMDLKHLIMSENDWWYTFDIFKIITMQNQIIEFVHLKKSFPQIIGKVKAYMGMDQDFYRLCRDFEDATSTIEILENTTENKTDGILFQIGHYRLLKAELEAEIESFIEEEQKIR